MKKTTTFTRKRAALLRREPWRRLNCGPVEAAISKAAIAQDLQRLATHASLHALLGEKGVGLVAYAGRMHTLVGLAATRCGVSEDHPDMLLLRAMGEAVSELACDLDNVDRHRPAIQAGLQAAQRLMPLTNEWSIGLAALELDEQINRAGAQPIEHRGML